MAHGYRPGEIPYFRAIGRKGGSLRKARDRLGNPTATVSRPTRLVGLLNRRAGQRAVGAEHAAIARLGPQHRLAALAVVKELAGVRRHRLRFLVPAARAGQRRVQLDGHGSTSVAG